MGTSRLRRLSILTGCALLLLAFAARGQRPVQGSVSATDADVVLRRIREAYSRCESYRDEGEVRTVLIGASGRKRTELKPFKTAFVRPDRFRFEYRDRAGEEEWNEYVVWTDGDGAHSWWTIKSGTRDWDDLRRAVTAAMGVSGGSSQRVPSLLMPDRIGGFFSGLPAGSRIVGEETLSDRACYKVDDSHGATLWFDKDVLLLRKAYRVTKNEERGFNAETTTTYRPEFDVQIPEQELSFDPELLSDTGFSGSFEYRGDGTSEGEQESRSRPVEIVGTGDLCPRLEARAIETTEGAVSEVGFRYDVKARERLVPGETTLTEAIRILGAPPVKRAFRRDGEQIVTWVYQVLDERAHTLSGPYLAIQFSNDLRMIAVAASGTAVDIPDVRCTKQDSRMNEVVATLWYDYR